MASAKVMSADVQRIASVLEELIQKLTLLSVVSHQVLEGVQGSEGASVSELLGPDLVRKMAEQTRLEELYQGSVTANEETGAAALDLDDMQEIVEQIERNTRDVCRRMREVPDIVQEMRVFQEIRPVNAMKFIHALAEMQGIMLTRLTTTVEDEKANDELLERYMQQEKQAAQRRADLEKQLTQLRSERERHSARSSEAIAKLKGDLHDIQSTTEQRLWQLSREHTKTEEMLTRAFQRKSGELEGLRMQLETLNAQQADTEREESEARQTNQRIAERDIENVIRAFDQDISEKERDIEKVKRHNQVDQDILSGLLITLRGVDEEKERLSQEAEIWNAIRNIEEKDDKKRAASACLLQSYWRGLRQREEYIILKRAADRAGKKKKKK